MDSIMQEYRKTIWNRFTKAIREFQLIQPGDRIAVCISGGKDSMLLAKCMEKYQKIGEVPFTLTFLCMDPGYQAENRRQILENADKLGLSLDLFETKIFTAVERVQNNPCYLCARMRRGTLYQAAQERGCNKIALGHHFDDVIETILMGMLYGGQLQTMMPKLHSDHFQGMQLIRPFYYVREDAIIDWAEKNKLHFLRCACRMTAEQGTDQQNVSKRQEIKELIHSLKKVNPDIEHHIFRSIWNVDLKHLISYHQGEVYHHFMDHYDDV
ncbi:MAG: ATP-binding protein [Ruminococcus sp.]